MTTSAKVRELIKNKKLSQASFAHSIGMHPVTLCKNLHDNSLSMKTLSKIADKYQVSIDSLLPDEAAFVEEKPYINGYVEYNGIIEAIRSKEDLERVWRAVNETSKSTSETDKKEYGISRSYEGYCLLFDLDNTLINSDAKRPLMEQKPLDWKSIDGCIPKYRVYEGIVEVLKWAKDKGIKVGIVSSTRRDHIEKVLKFFNLSDYIDLIVGNQRAYKKPHPKLVEMALEGLGVKAENTLYIGDHDVDAEMCARAGIRFVGCIWDSWHEKELAALGCKTISDPMEIKTCLRTWRALFCLNPKKSQNRRRGRKPNLHLSKRGKRKKNTIFAVPMRVMPTFIWMFH